MTSSGLSNAKNMKPGLLGRAGLPVDRLWLRKIRSLEKSILYSRKHALTNMYNYCSRVNTDQL